MGTDELLTKIGSRKAKIAIIGQGYVGLPLSVEFAKAGFDVAGIDKDSRKINNINNGLNYITDIKDEEFENVIKSKKLKAYTSYSKDICADIIIITVPTPFTANREPDLSYVIEATESVTERLKKGQLIILESTTFPGTTEEVVKPILEKSGLKAGSDFSLCFSPERIDPGNKQFTIRNTPKVVGGIDEKSVHLACELYNTVVNKTIPVTSAKVAEMSKLLENIFRNVNIALVNELMLLCNRIGIDVWEVIEAASTKPFGYMPFYPGPGVGGHCIPVDPIYLSWKARASDFYLRFVDLAAEINSNIPYYVAQRVVDTCIERIGFIKGARLLAIGVTFKKDVDDTRNSPALKVLEILSKKPFDIMYNDPYVDEIRINERIIRSTSLNKEALLSCDCVVILTDHSCYDYSWVVENSKLIVDARNATRHVGSHRDRIVKI